MCGICGYIDYATTASASAELVGRMATTMRHRGPNDAGTCVSALPHCVVAFGHARLSIQDLSSLGHQPMMLDKLQLVLNGEIYNFRELRAELEACGHTFRSTTDTEVVLHAYQEWGEKCVERFIGMFAFALYDADKEEVLLFRDCAGVKPLFYYWNGTTLIFASELKALQVHPAFSKRINMAAVDLYMRYGDVPAPYSIFADTRKVQPGSVLHFSLKNRQIIENKYWNIADYYRKPRLTLSYQEAQTELHALLRSAYQYRMVADVPVGVFLSGGFDSVSVAAILQANSTEKLKTFTIGFWQGNNEAPAAKAIAQYLGTDHTEYYCTEKEAIDIIPELPYYYDEPFADSSAIPTMLVSRLAKQTVSVALSADGGDELFTGYNDYASLYRKLQWLRFVPHSGKLYGLLSGMCPSSLHTPKRILEQLRQVYTANEAERIAMLLCDSNYTDGSRWGVARYKTVFEPYEMQRGDFSDFSDVLSVATCINYNDYLQNDILVKVDRATMAVSLEGREPMLDRRVVEFAAQLPQDYKFQDGNKKRILKDIVYQYVPKEMMDRPKTGFTLPIYQWLHTDLAYLLDEELGQTAVERAGVFNYAYVHQIKQLFAQHKLYDNSELWKLLMFHSWHRRWMQS